VTKNNVTSTLHGIGKGILSHATASALACSVQYERRLGQEANPTVIKNNLMGTMHGIGKGVPSFAAGPALACLVQCERRLVRWQNVGDGRLASE